MTKCSFVSQARSSSISIMKGLTRNMESLLFYPASGGALYLFMLTVTLCFAPCTAMGYAVSRFLLCIFSS